jgi:hypothetical protein
MVGMSSTLQAPQATEVDLRRAPPCVDFDETVMRRLVASDPLLAYTLVRQAGQSEDEWLRSLFRLDVCIDPALRTRYRSLAAALAHTR